MSSGGWETANRKAKTARCPVCGGMVLISSISPAYAGLASVGEMHSHTNPESDGWYECPGSRKTPEEAVSYMMDLIAKRIEAAQASLNSTGESDAN